MTTPDKPLAEIRALLGAPTERVPVATPEEQAEYHRAGVGVFFLPKQIPCACGASGCKWDGITINGSHTPISLDHAHLIFWHSLMQVGKHLETEPAPGAVEALQRLHGALDDHRLDVTPYIPLLVAMAVLQGTSPAPLPTWDFPPRDMLKLLERRAGEARLRHEEHRQHLASMKPPRQRKFGRRSYARVSRSENGNETKPVGSSSDTSGGSSEG
jgi:hypothetical protein